MRDSAEPDYGTSTTTRGARLATFCDTLPNSKPGEPSAASSAHPDRIDPVRLDFVDDCRCGITPSHVHRDC